MKCSSANSRAFCINALFRERTDKGDMLSFSSFSITVVRGGVAGGPLAADDFQGSVGSTAAASNLDKDNRRLFPFAYLSGLRSCSARFFSSTCEHVPTSLGVFPTAACPLQRDGGDARCVLKVMLHCSTRHHDLTAPPTPFPLQLQHPPPLPLLCQMRPRLDAVGS